VAYGWWVNFLGWVSDNASWMAKLVAVGETAIGICLTLGLFTGVMAFLGVVLNLSFMFSGSAGVNPAFAIVGLLLVLAWRNAGWYGLDRWVLPRIGTPGTEASCSTARPPTAARCGPPDRSGQPAKDPDPPGRGPPRVDGNLYLTEKHEGSVTGGVIRTGKAVVLADASADPALEPARRY
jgi:hypothetical protein